MIMCVLLCYPISIHMSQLLSTGRLISSKLIDFLRILSLFTTTAIFAGSGCFW